MITLDNVRQRAQIDARARGYYLNPDPPFLNDLLEGLKTNEERYGYPSCPCRAAAGDFESDRDIICPCDYRDPDVEEFGACYCALFVSQDVHEGKRKLEQIPERRPLEKQYWTAGPGGAAPETVGEGKGADATRASDVRRTLFYCRQCGYVVFRDEPPYVCPICRAKREMFSGISVSLELASR